MQFLYKYPQLEFPYQELIEKNKTRSKLEPEYEILDTGIFDGDKYFDLYLTYAKYSKRDIGIKIEIINRGKAAAPITVLPTLWFYNRWQSGSSIKKPFIKEINKNAVKANHERLGAYYLYFLKAEDRLFTENETNYEKLFDKPNETPFVKDAFHDAIIHQENIESLRNKKSGTKFSPVYKYSIKGVLQK